MIPEANVKNLVHRKDTVMAVEKGRFAIYRVAIVKQGMEILSSVPSGTVYRERDLK